MNCTYRIRKVSEKLRQVATWGDGSKQSRTKYLLSKIIDVNEESKPGRVFVSEAATRSRYGVDISQCAFKDKPGEFTDSSTEKCDCFIEKQD